MKWILFLFLCGPQFCAAVVLPQYRQSSTAVHLASAAEILPGPGGDSSVRPAYTKEDFMNRYGRDDTSKALIRYYFFKAKGYRTMSWLPFVIAVPLTALFLAIASQHALEKSSGETVVFGLLAILALASAIPLSIVSAANHRHFRKKLLAALNSYQENGKISPRILRSQIFRVALRGEPGKIPWYPAGTPVSAPAGN